MKQNIEHLSCPHCQKRIADSIIYGYTGRRAGRVSSPRKIAAARRNGRKGGRPRKVTRLA